MQLVKAVYDNGHLVFPEGNGPEGTMEVVVVFPDRADRLFPATRTPANGSYGNGKALKGCDISNWQDEKAEYLKGKPRENTA